jgi:hypothetical protein
MCHSVQLGVSVKAVTVLSWGLFVGEWEGVCKDSH